MLSFDPLKTAEDIWFQIISGASNGSIRKKWVKLLFIVAILKFLVLQPPDGIKVKKRKKIQIQQQTLE